MAQLELAALPAGTCTFLTRIIGGPGDASDDLLAGGLVCGRIRNEHGNCDPPSIWEWDQPYIVRPPRPPLINGATGIGHQVVKGPVKSWKRFPGLNSQYAREYLYNFDESAPDSCGWWSEVTQAATA